LTKVTSHRTFYSVADSTFSISEAAYNFKAIRCKLPPQSTIKEEGSCDIGTGKKYNIGFKLKRKFFGLIEVCYDTANQSTLNTKHRLSKSVGNHDFKLQMNSHFRSSGFGTENTRMPDDFYSCKNQLKTLERLLGSSTQAKKYINCNHKSNMYLDNCHLAPKGDFLFEYQKKAANFYINTAPQWKAISTGNWNILQLKIRRYASIRKVDLTVVTGTMNVTALQDASGTDRDLYLSKDTRNKPTVPVPAVFWKLVLDTPRKAGIVFVCLNNPYHYDIRTSDYVICTDICNSTTSWLDGWNRLDITKGYVYCCTVDEFRLKSNIKPFPFRARNILH
jgi:DNA/RNA endonuclease G, NUC1